ncbi:MAG: PspC domain-containing protein, partial [Actinomycetota bacterium]|nr:PspC domain-containing protein [Actinomycetota bacterium]
MAERDNAPVLRRTTDDRVVSGVCGGLAERLSIDAVAVRVVFVLGAMVWGASILVYALLWRVLPSRDAPTRNPVRPTRLPSMSLAMGAVAFMAAAMVALRSLGALPPDAVVLPLSLASLGVMFLWAGQPLRPVPRPALGDGGDRPPRRPSGGANPVGEAGKAARPARQRAPFGSALVGATMIVACFGFLADRAGWFDVQWRLLGAW